MLSELRVAGLLVDRFVPYTVPGSDRTSVAALCGHLDVRELREAFFEAFAPRPEHRKETKLISVVARVIAATGIEEQRGQILAGQAAVKMLARVFNLTLTSYPWFEGRSRAVATEAAKLQRMRVTSGSGQVTATRERDRANATSSRRRTEPGETRPTRPTPEVSPAASSLPTPPNTPSVAMIVDAGTQAVAPSTAVVHVVATPVVPQSEPVAVGIDVTASPEQSHLNVVDQLAPMSRSEPIPQRLVTHIGTVESEATRAVTVRRVVNRLASAPTMPAHEQITAAFQYAADALLLWREDPTQDARYEELKSALEAVGTAAGEMATALPAAHTVRDTLDTVSTALAVDPDRELDASAEALLEADLETIGRVAAHVRRLRDAPLPRWIVPQAIPARQRQTPAGWLQALLIDKVLCDDLEKCLQLATDNVESGLQLQELSEPGENGTLQGKLAAALHRAREEQTLEGSIVARLDRIASSFSAEVVRELKTKRQDQSRWLEDVERAESMHERFAALKDDLYPAVNSAIAESIQRFESQASQLLSDAEMVRRNLGASLLKAQATLDAIRLLASREPPETRTERAKPEPSQPMQFEAALMHPLSGPRGAGNVTTYAATLVWYRPSRTQPFGVVWLPIRFSITSPPDAQTSASLEVRGDILRSSPKEWLDAVVPVGVDLAPKTRTDFRVPIPLSEVQAEQVRKGKPLTLRISLNHKNWAQPITQELTWRELRMELPVIGEPFPQNVPLDQMLARPLGIENRYNDLVDLVQLGNRSFVVTGQRRYGKSTLIRAVVQTARKFPDVVVLDEVVATGNDVVEIWRKIAQTLVTRFSRPVLDDLDSGIIPMENAFDVVREEAARQGVKAIYILIDEAQALFATPARARLAERIKDRLERTWGVGTSTRAAIRLGLIGQTHLKRLMGTNLQGALPAVFPAEQIKADELLPLLRYASADGIQSTAEARDRLAALSGNLYILDQLLQGVLRRCRAAGRSWFYETDVDETADQLVEGYRRGTDITLWKYVRDVLNESDDLEQWIPSETFPVAMAWARALDDGLQELDAIKARATEILQAWARDCVILEGRITDAVDQLQASSVLTRTGEFYYPMLHRLLAVRSKSSVQFESEAEREALDRLGMPRIRRPPIPSDANDPDLSKGGQALVYKAKELDQALAVRCVRLDTPTARRRFMNEVDLLNKLNHAAPDSRSEWMDVMSHIPKVIRAGLAEDDRGLGVVIYQWVHGECLQRESLSDLAALSVARHLTAVLDLISQMQIVHRDIRPENVIIRSSGQRKPVLIDFGLVRAVGDLQHEPDSIAGVAEFLPPEVLGSRDARQWTPAGDVFSLGKTLSVCLRPGSHAPELARILERMMRINPVDRPLARELNVEFVRMDEDARHRDRENAGKQQIKQQIQRLPKALRAVAESCVADIWACQIGLEADEERRLATVAAFLESCFQIAVSEHPDVKDTLRSIPGTTYLTKVRDVMSVLATTPLAPFNCKEALAVGHLRNANAHPSEFSNIAERAYKALLKSRPPARDARSRRELLRPAVDKVSRELDRYFASNSIAQLTNAWLGQQR